MSENNEVLDAFFGRDPNRFSQNTNDKCDEIIIIVDRSGSMGAIKTDAEGGLNTFIKEQQEVDAPANLTLVEFDSEIDTVCTRIDLQEAEEYKLTPRGTTALLDAIGVTLTKFDSEVDSSGKRIVVIVTDGDDNASKEFTKDQIFEQIKDLKSRGWEFMFLAANQDAISSAGSIGIDAATAMNYSHSDIGTQQVYAAASAYTRGFRTKSKSEALDDLEKMKSQYSDIS